MSKCFPTSDGKTMPPNPKQFYGDQKVPLHLFPFTAIALGAMGFLEGKLKYGQDNFRGSPVEAMTYVRAALSHVMQYAEGEWAPDESDPNDSPVPHLGLALDCIAIIIDAHYAGTLIDNRKMPGGYLKALAEMKPKMERLKHLYGDKNPKHYDINDAQPTNTTVVDKTAPEGYVGRQHIPPTKLSTGMGVEWGTPQTQSDAKVDTKAEAPTPDHLTARKIVAKIEHGDADHRAWLRREAVPLIEEALCATRAPKPFTFWYLATPYTKFPAGHVAAFNLAARLSARLMLNNVKVFSPIAHSHPIAQWMSPEQVTNHKLWMDMDAPLMEAASGMIVVTAESWEASKGMHEEIRRFKAAGKPVIYWAPDCNIPTVVLESAS